MTQKTRKIIEEIIYWITLASISSILYFTFVFFNLQTSSYSDYFQYTELKSTKLEYNIWEEITFISSIKRPNPLNMQYNDILRCSFDWWKNYTWYSSYISQSSNLAKVGMIVAPWRYEWELPNTPAKCYLDSYPTVLLDFWITKTQNIKSNYFLIK